MSEVEKLKEVEDTPGKSVWAIVFSVLTFVLCIYLYLHVWLWFVVPIFHVAPLNIPSALGLCIVFTAFCKDVKFDKPDDKYKSSFKRSIALFMTYAWLLVYAYIVHLFM